MCACCDAVFERILCSVHISNVFEVAEKKIHAQILIGGTVLSSFDLEKKKVRGYWKLED